MVSSARWRALKRHLDQQAVVERPESETNEAEAAVAITWVEYVTYPCALWWWKGSESTGKSPAALSATEQRTLADLGGVCVIPWTDEPPTPECRVARVLLPNGDLFEEGPLRIVSVDRYIGHIELVLEKP